MSTPKEINYFSHEYKLGIDWYKTHFESEKPVKIFGEFSPSYMRHPKAPRRLADLIPSTKLFFIFRNPIERAYSSYWFSASIGTQDINVSFSEAIRSAEGKKRYVATGYYDIYLKRFLKYFKLNNIYILPMEDLSSHPLPEMQKMYQFLGVDPQFTPKLVRAHNRTISSTNSLGFALYRGWWKIIEKVKPRFDFLPSSIRRNLSSSGEKIIQMAFRQDRPKMEALDREYLSNIFGPHNTKLSKIIGRNLY